MATINPKMAEVEVNVEHFVEQLTRIYNDWIAHKAERWGGADAVCIPFGIQEDMVYSKSATVHVFLFELEDFTDSIILIAKNSFHFMASSKKCAFLQKQFEGKATGPFSLTFYERTKDEGMNREHFNTLMNVVRKNNGKKLGSVFKDKFNGKLVQEWMAFVDQSQIEKVEVTAALGRFFAVKNEAELVLPFLHACV